MLAHLSKINNKRLDIVAMSLLQAKFILGKQYKLLFLNMLVTTSRKIICKKIKIKKKRYYTMANPSNMTMTLGRLARDVRFVTNKDDSKTVFLTVMAQDNYKSKGEFQAQAISYRKYLRSDKQIAYYEKWGKKGNRVHIIGHVESVTFEKDGETEYRTDLVADDVDLSSLNAGRTDAAASADDAEEIF